MTSAKSLRFDFLIFIGLVLIVGPTVNADWPTYRHDKARSGCTDESLAAPLRLRWVYTSAHPPRPAWSGPAKRPREGFEQRHRVIFDDAFQVAVVDGIVYFGSSSDNKVYAFDGATGREIWSFYTGGPVRLAPTVHEGRVLFGSDDGYVYCLKAKNGELIWKVHPGPNDERLLGNGSMISRWPVRTSVLVEDDIVYFTAGIFPHENVYICAVRLNDGGYVWRNDTISEDDAYRNEFTPQGYMLAGGKQFFIPSGRALPVGFDRATGRVVFRSSYGWRGEQAGGLIGGTYALLADNQIYTGTQNHLLALDQKTGRVGFGWFPGRRLAVVGDMAYMATGERIVAMDRTKYAVASRRRNSLEYSIKRLRGGNKKEQLAAAQKELDELYRENITPAIKWSVASSCDAELILCKNLVFAGGQGEVNAHSRETGEVIWKAKVDGK
ncbi:MAG: PQQ-binding-like beta-propeller repeat protein, partial [Planctomycetota bacterium]